MYVCGTSASFQAIETLHSRKEQFKMSAIGAARISAYVFRTQFGKSSGPPAREFLMARSALATRYSFTDIGSSSSAVSTRTLSDRGMFFCKTLMKSLFLLISIYYVFSFIQFNYLYTQFSLRTAKCILINGLIIIFFSSTTAFFAFLLFNLANTATGK